MWEQQPVRYPPENWRAPPEAGYLAAQGMRRDSADPWRPVRPPKLLWPVRPVALLKCIGSVTQWLSTTPGCLGWAAFATGWETQVCFIMEDKRRGWISESPTEDILSWFP